RTRPGLDRAAEHEDEQQHERDRHERGRDDGVQAARDVAQGSSQQEGGVAEEMHGHELSPTMARNTSSRVGCFSTYSTLAGGSSFFSSARLALTMIRPWWRIAIRSASCSASSGYCVVSSTVVPLSARSLTDRHTSRRPWGSSPVVGSSRKMTCGLPMRLIAM